MQNELSDRLGHIVLYAKGRYRYQDGEPSLSEIKLMLQRYSNLSEAYLNDYNAFEAIFNTYEIIAPFELKMEMWATLFIKGSDGIVKYGNTEPVDYKLASMRMLRVIKNTKIVECRDFNGKTHCYDTIRLPEPQERLLPINKEHPNARQARSNKISKETGAGSVRPGLNESVGDQEGMEEPVQEISSGQAPSPSVRGVSKEAK